MYHLRLLFLLVIGFMIATTLSAQENSPFTPSIIFKQQVISKDIVTIETVVAQQFGVLAIYADDGMGQRGGLLGFSLLRPGVTHDVEVYLQMINITPRLHAVLHLDTEPYGEFQYGTVDGADSPVLLDEQVVTDVADVVVISVHDQFVDPDNFNRIVVDTATVSFESDAWLVAYNHFGDVLGHTFLEEGTSQNIPILLQGDVSPTIQIATHLDTGDPEKFEFLDDASIDIPLLIDGEIATTVISTVLSIKVDDQIVIGSDLTRNQAEQVPVLVDSVLSPVAGWLVVYADDSLSLDDVIGFAPIQAGFNDNVNVLATQSEITPRLFVSVHEDTGESLVFEYGDIEGVDLPMMLEDGRSIVETVMIQPSILDVTVADNMVMIDRVLMDTAGWLVAYALTDRGQQADILGQFPLRAGVNSSVMIDLAETDSDQIRLVLHYDTRPVGIFSFESEEGSDLPLVFEGEPIVIDVALGVE